MLGPTIRYDSGGVHLPELGLWLDARRAQLGPERVFVSHAHSDHIAAHRESILSGPTAQFLRARIGRPGIEHSLPYGQPREFQFDRQPFQITLLPAGHILGSAMGWVEARGTTVLYTGDFKLSPSWSSEPCEPRHADVLIMETTFGRPAYRFPARDEVLSSVIRFCREVLGQGEIPVLLAYSLGKSQEVLLGLKEAGLPIMVHGQIHKLTEIYRELGHQFPEYHPYDPAQILGKVLLCPPNAIPSAQLQQAGTVRTAAITGWAMDSSYRFRARTDAAFPISDHADFGELIELVRRVAPKKVYTLHGFAADFAMTLRDLGFDAEAFGELEQLTLPLHGDWTQAPPVQNLTHRREAEPSVLPPARAPDPTAEGFARFCEICLAIGATSSRREKVQTLANYLRSIPEEQLPLPCGWVSGHPFPPAQNKPLQLGWALIRDGLCAATQIDQTEFGQVFLNHSDLGETAFEILANHPRGDRQMNTLRSIEALFQKLHAEAGTDRKHQLLVEFLHRAEPVEGKCLVKILTGDLRIGLKEGLVEEAIAVAFAAALDEVKTAHLLTGDISETALLTARKQLDSAALTPFRPIKFMLASPEETAEGIWNRAQTWLTAADSTPAPLWIEDKYDGIRAQLHKIGQQVAIYSRDLKEVTASFGELVDAARRLTHDFVIDGEIVAMRGEEVLPFADLQHRLGRRQDDLFLATEKPVQFLAFDLLWLEGQSWLSKPLRDRRAALERLPGLRLGQVVGGRSAADIDEAFAQARARGNEGLVLKNPSSAYYPGRAGSHWLKFKKANGTLDCVVVGAEYGQGKRNGVLSNYTFAVRDTGTNGLKILGKAYIGLTDAEIMRLTEHFLAKCRARSGRYLEVEPDTVLEIAFDSVQPSGRHSSGLALRFPRILRIRPEKSAGEISTLEEARRFVKARGGVRSAKPVVA